MEWVQHAKALWCLGTLLGGALIVRNKGTMCVHDHEIKKIPNVHDFPLHKNDIHTNVQLENPSSTYTSEKYINCLDPNHMYMPQRLCEKYD